MFYNEMNNNRSLENKAKKYRKGGITYRLFKSYIRFFHDRIYYRRTYSLHTENIPAPGTPLMIVSNHQNCINDPIGILLSIRDRKPFFIMRADVFAYHPLLNKFFRSIGLLPAFRIGYEGEEALQKNKDTFLLSAYELINGSTLVMYPEAGHQDKHWLGDFSLGYAKMVFEAAALDNFRTEIFILPSCNHYSDYFRLQEQMLIKYGAPISIKPFYELYQTRPRTAQRQVNALVRKQIEALMLDVRDPDNYEAIDFIRNSAFGRKFAKQHQYDEDKLPERLLSDRLLVDNLEKIKAGGKEEALAEIYADALTLKKGIDEMKINDALFDRCPSWGVIFGYLLLLLAGLPLWVFSLWPNVLNYIVPNMLISRMTDKMFYGTFMLVFSILITIPLLYTLTFVLACIFANVWVALIYSALLPLLALFAWYYRKFFLQTMQALRFRLNFKTKKLGDLKDLRAQLYNHLANLNDGSR
jgi:1-acyl-sn-glycerol-3-phosphate acyltransferase